MRRARARPWAGLILASFVSPSGCGQLSLGGQCANTTNVPSVLVRPHDPNRGNHYAGNAVQGNLFMTAIEISDCGISGRGQMMSIAPMNTAECDAARSDSF